VPKEPCPRRYGEEEKMTERTNPEEGEALREQQAASYKRSRAKTKSVNKA